MNMNEYNYTSAALELFAAIVTAMMLFSKALCSLGELVAQPQQLLMMLAGMVTVLCVWGYNKVLDARIEM